MFFKIIFSCFIFLIFSIQATNAFYPYKIIKLDKKVKESSAILYLNNNIWTLNDSGGKNELYEIDKKTGKIKSIKKIIGAKNIDWEDITQNKKYIFIGDIGNNSGKRKKLQIYKIKKEDFIKKDNFVKAEKIDFSYNINLDYNEQKNKFSKMDSEALIFYNNNLYIFSKGWKDYKINVYKIDLLKKNQVVKLVSTGNINGLITGATVSENKIYLVGYKTVFVNNPFIIEISDFKNDDFFSGKLKTKKIFKDIFSVQIESIDIGNNKIFISSEKDKYASVKKQSLFILDLDNKTNNLIEIKKIYIKVKKYLIFLLGIF